MQYKEWSVVMTVSVYLFVCLSVNSHAYLSNHTSELHQIFYAACQWPWISMQFFGNWSNMPRKTLRGGDFAMSMQEKF